MSFPSKTVNACRENFRWDVFLSYQTPDREMVAEVHSKLLEMGLKIWWDYFEIPPGAHFMDKMWEGLKGSWATIVFIGPNTMGKWQNIEVKAAIASQVGEGRPVLPVFLPGAPNPSQVDIEFLSVSSCAVFDSSATEQRVLNRIYWGITGTNPDRPKSEINLASNVPAVAAPDQATEAVSNLARWLRTGNVTFFVGPSVSKIGPALPPRGWEIACSLLTEVGLLKVDENKLLPPVDVAATLYALSKTDPVLEETVVTLIQSRSGEVPAAHQKLAQLLAALDARVKPRGRRVEKQLILTTNIDLMMERALLRARLKLTRVVQHKSERSLRVTNYYDAGYAPQEAGALDDFIMGSPESMLSPEMTTGNLLAEPILYKLRGSQDISGSCALTRLQLLAQARAVIAEHLIPAELQKIAGNTPIVFLGTGLLDPDFQYISHTVLHSAWSSDHPKYLVQMAPEMEKGDGYRQMEAGLWDKIKQVAMRRNLTTVEDSSERFLQSLIDAI